MQMFGEGCFGRSKVGKSLKHHYIHRRTQWEHLATPNHKDQHAEQTQANRLVEWIRHTTIANKIAIEETSIKII